VAADHRADLIIHLIRNTFRLASRRDWDALKRDVRPIYTAVNAGAARAALDQLSETWGSRYPAIVRLWENGWEEFIPFLDYDLEIRTVLCSTDAIESLNARYRRAVKARGHFPTEQAAKVPVPGHPVPGPHRQRPGAADDAVEARAQRFRHHLRRPVPGRRNVLTEPPETPLARQSLAVRAGASRADAAAEGAALLAALLAEVALLAFGALVVGVAAGASGRPDG
jgi:hypothetical protein